MSTKMLRKVSFFKVLRTREISRILSIARPQRYKRDTMVFHKKDIGNNFFIVKSGRIKIFSSIGPEKRKTFAYLKKGDFFGEMSLLGRKMRSASAQAVDDSELLVISKKNFRALIFQSPDFTLQLLHTLVDRIGRCDKEIESMLFHNILGRLASAVISLAGDKQSGAFSMAMSQTELADYMGTTRVPVCRAVSTLKRNGIISYKRGELTVLDMAKLRSMAGNAS